jgi:hypothetical protein
MQRPTKVFLSARHYAVVPEMLGIYESIESGDKIIAKELK